MNHGPGMNPGMRQPMYPGGGMGGGGSGGPMGPGGPQRNFPANGGGGGYFPSPNNPNQADMLLSPMPGTLLSLGVAAGAQVHALPC